MIKEKAYYSADLPINIRIAEIEEYPLHFHQDIEFVYVLKGEINLKCGYFTYRLTEGNVFTINGREVHGLYRAGQDNIVALVQIDNYFFSRYFNRLSGSCFRTFTNDKNDERIETLRRYFAGILLESAKKEPGYKRQIIDLVIQLLAYLNEFFHYFSFENKVVVNTRNDNPVFVERLGRMINYIYEKHAEKLTLEDLSAKEHLSTYYISHLFAEGTGMNFREFLCFARVEFSEMSLLDTNKKINAIAQEVGFSATSYYIKYFKKWYGMTPEEYRYKYGHDTKAPNIPARLKRIEPGTAIKLLHGKFEVLPPRPYEGSSGASLPMEIHIDCNAVPMGHIKAEIVPHCRESVLIEHFNECTSILKELRIHTIDVIADQVNDLLYQQLAEEGLLARQKNPLEVERICFGMDSMAALSHILKLGLNPDVSEICISNLIDDAKNPALLKGDDGIFTSGWIPKPSYFAYQMLSHAEGALLQQGKYHAVIRVGDEKDRKSSYCILCCQHHEEIENLCSRPSSMSETMDCLETFRDSLEFGIHLDGIYGQYRIVVYRLSGEGSLLQTVSKNKIGKVLCPAEEKALAWSSAPKTEVRTEQLAGSMFFQVSLKGLEAQCILVIPVQTEACDERR